VTSALGLCSAIPIAVTNDRHQVAEWAEQYLAGSLSFQRFMELVPEESGDSLVTKLVDLVEHEPKRGGILGATPEQYDGHMRKVRELIAALRES